jgi:hypothetical protein
MTTATPRARQPIAGGSHRKTKSYSDISLEMLVSLRPAPVETSLTIRREDVRFSTVGLPIAGVKRQREASGKYDERYVPVLPLEGGIRS